MAEVDAPLAPVTQPEVSGAAEEAQVSAGTEKAPTASAPAVELNDAPAQQPAPAL